MSDIVELLDMLDAQERLEKRISKKRAEITKRIERQERNEPTPIDAQIPRRV